MTHWEPPEPAPREPVRDPDEGWDSRDNRDAGLAHQQQLERRHEAEQRTLANDPGYLKWLDELNEQRRADEISR